MSLMSMGFDITDCQDAITFGKNTVEAAVEWYEFFKEKSNIFCLFVRTGFKIE